MFEAGQSSAETLGEELGEEAVEQLGSEGVEAVLNNRCHSSILYKIQG